MPFSSFTPSLADRFIRVWSFAKRLDLLYSADLGKLLQHLLQMGSNRIDKQGILITAFRVESKKNNKYFAFVLFLPTSGNTQNPLYCIISHTLKPF